MTILAAFADDPTSTLDTSCINPSTGMLVAPTPTVTSEDGTSSITAELPVGLTEQAPGSGSFTSLTTQLALQALPKQDLDEVIADQLEVVKSVQPVGEIVDGPEIAGWPSRHYVGTVDGYAPGAGIDVFAFSDENATYVITALYSDAGTLESVFRGDQLAATLESVELGK